MTERLHTLTLLCYPQQRILYLLPQISKLINSIFPSTRTPSLSSTELFFALPIPPYRRPSPPLLACSLLCLPLRMSRCRDDGQEASNLTKRIQ